MAHVSTYLVCHEHIGKVKKFLSKFFKEEKGKYSHSKWVSFKLKGTDFTINLLAGKDQALTQNIVFEINCKSKKELEKYAKKYKKKIHNFLATATGNPYRFYYIEIPGPKNICKIDISRCEEEL